MIKKHLECKQYFMDMDRAMSFSYDLQQQMTEEEKVADQKLMVLRDIIASKDYSCTINRFKELHSLVQASGIYSAINEMPKGAIHHIHSTACIPVEAFLDLTRDDSVYFNDRDKLLKCYPNPKKQQIDSYYVQCN